MVEWKKLGDIGTFIRGTGIQKTDFVDDGYPCIHYGQIHTKYGISADKTFSFISEDLYKKSKKAVKGDVVLATTSEDAEGVAKPVAWLGDNDVAISGDAFIFHHNQNGKYLAHVFASHRFNLFKVKHVSGTKVVRITGDSMAKFEFPLPPLSEQIRIVGILDTFTESIENLKKQITERKKQYEYYRDQLLFCTEINATIHDVASFGKGRISSINLNEYNYVSVENLLKDKAGKAKSTKIPEWGFWSKFLKNDILIGNIRPYLRKIWFADIEGGTNGDVVIIRPNLNEVIPRFLFNVLSSERFFIFYNQTAKGGKMPRGEKSRILKFAFFLPDRFQQSRIVSILDTFEASITNLEAQLSLRQKQYEYYRNMLLTFDE